MFRLHKHKVNTAPEWNLSKEPGPFLIFFFFLRYFSHVFLTFAFSHIANQLLGFSISRLANVEHFFNVYIYCLVYYSKLRFCCLTCLNLNSADFTTTRQSSEILILKIDVCLLEFQNETNIEITGF